MCVTWQIGVHWVARCKASHPTVYQKQTNEMAQKWRTNYRQNQPLEQYCERSILYTHTYTHTHINTHTHSHAEADTHFIVNCVLFELYSVCCHLLWVCRCLRAPSFHLVLFITYPYFRSNDRPIILYDGSFFFYTLH